jgi:hypothetical protein
VTDTTMLPKVDAPSPGPAASQSAAASG